MRGHRKLTALIPPGVAALLAACFNYVVAESGAVPLGENVRIHLTNVAVAELTEFPNRDSPYLTGTLVSRQRDDLFVRVPTATRQVGFHSMQLGQDLRIPAGGIVRVEQRRLDRVRTGLFAAGIALSAAAVVFAIMEAEGGIEPDVPLPPEMRVPLSIPLIR